MIISYILNNYNFCSLYPLIDPIIPPNPKLYPTYLAPSKKAVGGDNNVIPRIPPVKIGVYEKYNLSASTKLFNELLYLQ